MDPFLFIVGYGRSGTTLVRAMFDAHPEMAVPDESYFLLEMSRRAGRYRGPRGLRTEVLLQDLVGHPWFRRWRVPEGELRAAFAASEPADVADALRTVYALYARLQGKSRYGDKTPIYVVHLPRLAAFLPEARFLHVVRDGRDVALSMVEQPFGPTTLVGAAVGWRRAVLRARRDGARLGPERYREVRYEDLVQDPVASLRPVCRLLGLPWDEAMLQYHQDADRLLVDEAYRRRHRNLRRPPTGGLRDWRTQMAPRDLAVIEVLAGGLLSVLGYELSSEPRGPGVRLEAGWRWADAGVRRSVRWARGRFGRLRRRVREGLGRGRSSAAPV
ncbi:MAG: sulfotransferase family protein [Actinomycetota bacterium]